MADRQLFAPAAERNREPILAVLQEVFPAEGLILEVASGTGQHCVHFARHMAGQTWQPSDPDPSHRVSVRGWVEAEGLSNVREPLELDTTWDDWGIDAADALLCCNMIHIAPWEACLGLWRGAERLLPAGAPLVLYGPYMVDGQHTAPSNERFDASLKLRNPAWGVRDLNDVKAQAEKRGFLLAERVPMPANNFTLIFVKQT